MLVCWWYHPTDKESVDVAAFGWDEPKGLDVVGVPSEMFLTDEIIQESNVGPGDEVFYPGLFSRHAGAEKNLPILRSGNIAMMPTEDLPDAKIGDYRGLIDAYLIEARSMGGLGFVT